MWKYAIVVVLGLLQLGCYEATPQDVVGRWVLKEESREWMAFPAKAGKGELIFKRDGEFLFFEVPAGLVFGGRYKDTEWPEGDIGRVVSGSGVWKPGTGEYDADILLTILSIQGDSTYTGTRGTYLDIWDVWKPFELYYMQNDEFTYVKFEKQL